MRDRAAHAALSDTARMRRLDALRGDIQTFGDTEVMTPAELAYRKLEAQMMYRDGYARAFVHTVTRRTA